MNSLFHQILKYTVIGTGLVIAVVGCSKRESQWPEGPGLKVAVSFAPYYCFATNVVGDLGHVKSVLSSQGPHHADTNIQERILLEEADYLFLNGLGLDNRFGKGLKETSSNANLKLVPLGDALDHALLIEPSDHDHEGHAHAHEDHDHDPHVWLSPLVARRLVEGIQMELRKNDSANATKYDDNAKSYIAKLDQLAKDGQALLKGKKERSFVTVHESLGYFASAFDLNIVGVIQKTPGQEPTQKELKELIELCVENQVRIIAVEPQYSSQGAVSTLKEALIQGGVQNPEIVEIDPLETANPADLTPDWYERKILQNVQALAKVLK